MRKYRWLDQGQTFVEITREDGSILTASQASDPDLWPLLGSVEVEEYTPPAPPPLEQVKLEAKFALDSAYAAFLKKVHKSWKSEIYALKLQEAQVVISGGESQLIRAEANVTGVSPEEVADRIVAMNQRSRNLLAEIEIQTIFGRGAVEASLNSDMVHETVERYHEWQTKALQRIDNQEL